MQVHLRKLASVVLSVILLISVFSGVSGADSRKRLDEVQQQLEDTRQRISAGDKQKQELEAQIQEADARMAAVQAGLTELENQLADTRDRKADIEAQLASLRAQLKQKQDELDQAVRELTKLTRLLNRRADHFYKHGQTSFLEVLIDSRSFGDFLHRFAFLQRIVNLDAKLVNQIKLTKAAIETARAAIEVNHAATMNRERELLAEESRIQDLVTAQAAQKAQLQASVNDKQAIIANLDSERQSLVSEEDGLEEAAREILARIGGGSGTTAGSAPSSSGFIWPASGPITGVFGEQRPGHLHAGIDIAVPTGTPVAASKGGTVVMSEYNSGGFGYVVVIDHGDGFTTWYGHNSQLLVNEGQVVDRGQTIARAGSTGRSSGPHVHFEVRYGGTAQNPMNYLP